MTCVLLATPSFEGRPCIEFVLSLLKTVRTLEQAGIGWEMTVLAGDPYLSKVRNRLASQFLTEFPHATDLMFLDDDIGWPPEKVVEFVRRSEGIVFGVYPRKKDQLEFPVELNLTKDGKLVGQDGVYSARLVPTGFMRIKRAVVEQMAQCVPRYLEGDGTGRQLVQWNIFEARYVDPVIDPLRNTDLSKLTRDEAISLLRRAVGQTVPTEPPETSRWWGEDFWFVERWRQMGGAVWCDPDIAFTHSGRKKWGANLGDSLRATLAAMDDAAAQAVASVLP